MLSSDEEIPYSKPVRFVIQRYLGNRIIVDKIDMAPTPSYNSELSKKENDSGLNARKTPRKQIFPSCTDSDAQFHGEMRPVRKSGEKLNNQSITELLYDSESDSKTSHDSNEFQIKDTRHECTETLKDNVNKKSRRRVKKKLADNCKGGHSAELGNESYNHTVIDISLDEEIPRKEFEDASRKKTTIDKHNTGEISFETTLNCLNSKPVEANVQCEKSRSKRNLKSKFDSNEWEVSSPVRKKKSNPINESNEQSNKNSPAKNVKIKSNTAKTLQKPSVNTPSEQTNIPLISSEVGNTSSSVIETDNQELMNRTPQKQSERLSRTCVKTVEKSKNECTPQRKKLLIQTIRTPETAKSPATPSSRRSRLKPRDLTPSMPACKRNFNTPQTPLQEAMIRLHVSAVPQSLPCREKEFSNIHRFLEGKVLDGAGGCIYISGVPGTGKTATVREVVRNLKQDVQNGDLPDFQFIEVNGMRLTHPHQSYVQIWKALSSELVTAEQAQRLLENRFTKNSSKGKSVVLLVDEVDVLWTRRQAVVYNLLDWPSKAKSRLVVVTIANTMDLPERLLIGRVTSRLGLTRLTFQPYSHKQLEEIVKARLIGIKAFDADSVQFVARKVASVSGDARRALDICRRATEIAEQESPDAVVTIKHVDEAMAAMTSSCAVQAILHSCSTIEKLFLQSVEAELNRTGLEETTFLKVYKLMETLCCLEGVELPSVTNLMRACMKLSSMRLLLCQNANTDVYSRIFLNVSSDDLHYALKCARKD